MNLRWTWGYLDVSKMGRPWMPPPQLQSVAGYWQKLVPARGRHLSVSRETHQWGSPAPYDDMSIPVSPFLWLTLGSENRRLGIMQSFWKYKHICSTVDFFTLLRGVWWCMPIPWLVINLNIPFIGQNILPCQSTSFSHPQSAQDCKFCAPFDEWNDITKL